MEAKSELLIGEEVKVRLSSLAADLKRISDRLMELSGEVESAADVHHNACECADSEVEHADLLLPDSPEETPAASSPGETAVAEPTEESEDSEEESTSRLPHVFEELRRHLGRMDRAMTEAVASGCEVGEVGCELLRLERDVRALIEPSASESVPQVSDDGGTESPYISDEMLNEE